MNNFNMAVIEGRLTRDSELKHTAKGYPYLKFCIANNLTKKINGRKEDSVSFFNVTAWNKLAEIMSPYLKKGKRIIVSGRIFLNKYQSKNGENKLSVDITANNIDFITSGKSNNKDGSANFSSDKIPY